MFQSGATLGAMAATLVDVVTEAADRFGDRVAIEDGDARLSFTQLQHEARRAARALIGAGVGKGDRVAIWAPNIHEWIVAAAGIHAAGGVLVPLNTRFKGAEAAYVLDKSRARVLFTVEELVGNRYVDMLRGHDLPSLERIVMLRGAAPDTTPLPDFLATARDVALPDVGPDDLSDILFTSGTTGKPKGVMTAHGQNVTAFMAWSEVVGLRDTDRYLIVNPFFHSFGYKAGFMAALMRGATILPQLTFDVPAVLARIPRDRVSMLPGPPTLYQSLMAHPERPGSDLSSLRLAVTGAAVIPVELVRRMKSDLGFETVITGYGLTETCGIVAMCRFDDDPETIATTSGRAIPDVEMICADDAGAEVPRGTPGEVLVRGYNVMRGYFEDDAATRETIDERGWLRTGDVGVIDARGYVRITDRKKDMFISGGFNCYPAEIENLMLGCPDVGQVAVVGAPDDRLGEVGVAFVVSAPDRHPTQDTIIAWCRDNMANYKVPRRVELVDALPTNATGKVTRFVLRDRVRAS